MELVLPALSPPLTLVDARPIERYIKIRHPGYDETCDIMLLLYASDHIAAARVAATHSSARPASGLYAQFVIDTCGIITGNRWDGWLSTSRSYDSEPVNPCSILFDHDYYFHLPANPDAAPEPYPVIPCFRQWAFPHRGLPPAWEQLIRAQDKPDPIETLSKSQWSYETRIRDQTCRMTGFKESTETAHLCPRREEEWWQRHDMSRYTPPYEGPNNPHNSVLLRSDLHKLFDAPKFVFVPKAGASGDSVQLVTHMLSASVELEALYHNRALQSVQFSLQAVFSRFAHSIFPGLHRFLTCDVDRNLLLYSESRHQTYHSIIPREQCTQYAEPSASKPKRSRPTEEPGDGDGDGDDHDHDNDNDHRGGHDTFAAKRSRHDAADESQTPGLAVHASSDTSATPHKSVLETSASTDNFPVYVKTWLDNERTRSDPEDTWKAECEWARPYAEGSKSMGPAEVARLYAYWGYESLEDPETGERMR